MMASSKIKGITIEIGGNTTKLQDALKGVDKQVYTLNGELKDLNQALKLDPKNTELLAQKQEVLARNIQASKDRLETLKEAQRQMGDYAKLTDEQKEAYNRLSLEIAKSEKSIKSMNDELKQTNKIDLTKFKDQLKKVGEVALDVSKTMLKVTSVVGAALTAIVADGVKSYAELEKAQKGSERLFGESFDIVKKNASSAYKSLGLSAKDYYDQVNTYAVGLKESLGGDSAKAAQLANDILVAQADIVAATGANQEAVQSAFSAVMRGNFTLIDNLRLGIKGSKEGMQEVIDKVNQWNKKQGKTTKYQMGNYADMQQALVDYVKMTGIAGTASKQLSSTINGSVSQMKAAFDNFINGTGSPEQLADALTTMLENIGNAISNLAPSILSGISSLIKKLLPKVTKMIFDLLPQLLNAITDLIDNILELVSQDTEELQKTVSTLINTLIKFIVDNLPKIIEIALQIVIALANGISDNLDVLIPAIVDCVLLIVDTLIDNSDLILEAGMKLIGSLIIGIINSIPTLLLKIPDIITKMYNKFKENIGVFKDIGKEILNGIGKGIEIAWNTYKVKKQSLPMEIALWFKSKLGIKSPSKVMREEVGKNIGLGIAVGIEDTIPQVENAMRGLTAGVDASVNPTINPTANTNPLFITIDKFYNNRETDIQQLAEELEFYRKNSALAKGGV